MKSTHLQEIAHIPLLTDHIVVCLASSQSRGLRVHHDLLDHKAHALESLLIRAVLPHSVVVDLVHPIDEAYLKIKSY